MDLTDILLLCVLLALLVAIFFLYKLNANKSIKYDFVAIIAHKFRTPLSTVKWTLDNLVPSEQDSFRKQDLMNVQKMNEQLIALTNTLIELADSDKAARLSYNFEKIGLCDVSKMAEQSLQGAAQEKNISFSVECYENPLVYVDKTRLQFVLYTIYHNAITYTPVGGKVSVAVGTDKKHAVVSVVDTGIGIDSKDVATVFEKFHRAANAKSFDTEGLGVGLYLSRAILNRLHGTIQVASNTPEPGTTFYVTLPVAK